MKERQNLIAGRLNAALAGVNEAIAKLKEFSAIEIPPPPPKSAP